MTVSAASLLPLLLFFAAAVISFFLGVYFELSRYVEGEKRSMNWKIREIQEQENDNTN